MAGFACVRTLVLGFLSFFFFSCFSVAGAVAGTGIEGVGVGADCNAVAAWDAAGFAAVPSSRKVSVGAFVTSFFLFFFLGVVVSTDRPVLCTVLCAGFCGCTCGTGAPAVTCETTSTGFCFFLLFFGALSVLIDPCEAVGASVTVAGLDFGGSGSAHDTRGFFAGDPG